MPKAPKTRNREVNSAANGYDFTANTFAINDAKFNFKYTINDNGTLVHLIQANFGRQSADLGPDRCPTHENFDTAFHALREIGPSASVYDAWGYGFSRGLTEISQYLSIDTADSCRNMVKGGRSTMCGTGPTPSPDYGGGFVDTSTDPLYDSSVVTKYICHVNEMNSRTQKFIAQTHLFSMTIIARTSVHEDQRQWNLVSTYMGLGLLAQVRESVITEENFLSGYTPLFDDIDTPDCGQRTYAPTTANLPQKGPPADPGYPGPGTLSFNNPNPSYRKTCGKSCAVVMPYSNVDSPIIWEMASVNGRYRLQFFDSGHVSFIDVTRVVPIYTTVPLPFPSSSHTDFPKCSRVELNDKNVGVYLAKVRDAWIIRGAAYKYVTSDSNHFLAPEVDLMVQITNYGALVVQKDYVYGKLQTNNIKGAIGLYQLSGAGEDIRTSHVMVQSVLPVNATADMCTLANFTAPGNTVVRAASGAIGVPSQNDTNNYQMHYSLGNVLVCQGFKEMAKYDWDNGTTLAYSSIVSGHRFFLWLGPFGLRLLRLPSEPNTEVVLPQPDDLEDWTGGTRDKSGCMWITKPYYEWFYSHDKASPPQRVNLMTAFKDCSLGAQIQACSLQTCGTFLKPVATPDDEVILTLRSPNKRYCFYMLSSGVCRLVGETVLYSTEDYQLSDLCDQETYSC